MRAIHRALPAVLLLVLVVDVRAQTAPPLLDARVTTLLSTLQAGQQEVPCDQLDAGVAQSLLDFAQRSRREPLDRLTTIYRLAERAARCAGTDALAGAALNGLSDTLFERGQLDAALAAARESIVLNERAKDEAGIAEAWNRVGNVYVWTLDTASAHDAFTHALDHTATSDRIGQARVFNNIGNAHKSAAEFDVALDYYARALQVFNDLGDRARAAVVTDNISDVYFRRGENGRALDYAQQALEINRALGNQIRIARSLDLAANIDRATGAYQRALQQFREALELRTKADDRNGVMETTHNIGLTYLSLGDYGLAIDAFKRGIHLNQVWALRDDSLVSEALHNIALAASRLGQHERAAADLRESLAIAERAKQPNIAASALHDLGQEALDQGKAADAWRLFERSLEIRRRIGDQAGITETLTGQAAVRLAEKRADAALSLAEQALDNAVAHDQPELLWHAQTVAGIAYRGLGRVEDAHRVLNDAVGTIDRLSREVAIGDNLREQFFETTLSPYHELIALLIDRRASSDALEIAERSKARALRRLLRRTRLDEEITLTAQEKDERARLRDRLFALNRQIENEHGKPQVDDTRVKGRESARKTAREALAKFDASMQTAHPELVAVRGAVDPLTRGDINQIFSDTNTAIVEYTVADKTLYAFVLTSDGRRVTVDEHASSISRQELERRTERFRDRISARDFGVGDDAGALYDLLIAPIATTIAGRSRLVIIPDGPLWNVPFQALRGPKGYLIETAAISYAPSITVLRDIQRVAKPSGARTLLAMGKSSFGSVLDPLPDAEQQVQQIRAIYGADRSATYVGDAATESQFKTAAPRYSVLHLATHAVLDESSPMYSRLILSSAPGHPDDDGQLEAWEIMGMKLRADLVVLAACETGRGRIASGEGVIGTMWALLAAGARSLVVSQFRVESTSTTTMLVAFHRRLATGRGSKADHLRAAALELLHTPRYAHPYYWAGFVLVGDAD